MFFPYMGYQGFLMGCILPVEKKFIFVTLFNAERRTIIKLQKIIPTTLYNGYVTWISYYYLSIEYIYFSHGLPPMIEQVLVLS